MTTLSCASPRLWAPSKSTTNSASMSSQDMQGQGAESQQLYFPQSGPLNINKKTPRYNQPSARWVARCTIWTSCYLMISITPPTPKTHIPQLSHKANRSAEALHCQTRVRHRDDLFTPVWETSRMAQTGEIYGAGWKTCGEDRVWSSWPAGAAAAVWGWVRAWMDGNQ